MTHNLMDDVIVDLSHVSQHYGDNCALDDITLSIPARKMVGLIGPDGVGKSSLISLIAGAREIQQGKVIVLGGDMADKEHRREVCPKIAYMPQGLGKTYITRFQSMKTSISLGVYLGNPKKSASIVSTIYSKARGWLHSKIGPQGSFQGDETETGALLCANS